MYAAHDFSSFSKSEPNLKMQDFFAPDKLLGHDQALTKVMSALSSKQSSKRNSRASNGNSASRISRNSVSWRFCNGWDGHMGTIKVIKDLLLSWMIHKFNRVNQIGTRETMLHDKYDEAKIDCKHLLLLLFISGRGAS
jgi:hypothetical protein